jgi:hypothetical protein
MVRLRSTRDIRWYLYRSGSKIDMLHEQLFESDAGRTASVTLSAPGISASVGQVSREETLDEKLRRIEAELKSRGLVGTLEQPNEYVVGTMHMRWGLFDDSGERPEGTPALVYFGGFEKAEPLIVGLGGSANNIQGFEGASSTQSRSNSRAIVRWLLSGIEIDGPPSPPIWGNADQEQREVLGGVAIALHYLKPPTQTLTFLAKTLLMGRIYGLEHFTGVKEARVLLGTPLHVHVTARHPDENRWGLDDDWNRAKPRRASSIRGDAV